MIAVRPATLADLVAIRAIDAQDRPAPRGEALFTAALPHLLACVEGAAVLGFAEWRVTLDEAELIDVAVTARRRRAGLGRRLVEAVMERGRLAGAARIFLEVREDNTPARTLYGALGFSVIGRRRGYYPGGVDAILYACPLGASGAEG